MRRLRNHPLRWLSSVLSIVALIVLLAPRTLGGPTSYILVAGESMTPTYENGDLVVVRTGVYSVGEVVAFETGSGVVIHRIVGGSADEGFVTQGDNKPSVDVWRPTQEDVLGEEFIHIPNGGTWVQRVSSSPLMMGGLLGGLGALMIWSPERGRKRRGAHSSRTRRAGPKTARSGTPSWGGGVGLLVLAGVTLVLAGATAYLFLRPSERIETFETSLYEHSGAHSFEATVSPSVVYEGTTITPESTDSDTTSIYTSLLENLQIDFSYEMTSSQLTDVEGVMSSELHIAAGENEWTRRIPLLAAESFDGNAASESFAVELEPILRMIRSAESQTDFAPASYQLTVVTEVLVGNASGSVDENMLTAELPMTLTEAVLSVDNVGASTETVTVSEERSVSNDIDLPWLTLPLRWARAVSGAALAILLLSTALFAYAMRLRVGRGDVAKIRLRYGSLIVPVTKAEQNGSHPVRVASMSDLARLARRADQMVFYKQNPPDEHHFFVPDGPVVYEYKLGSNESEEVGQ